VRLDVIVPDFVAEPVPDLLAVNVPEFVAETVAVRVVVVVPESVAETVELLETVTEPVPETVTEDEWESLGEGVPVLLTVEDPVLVRDTDTDAVGVDAAEAEVVAEVVFVAECVSGPLVSVAVVVCDAVTDREILEEGVADHVLDGVAVKVDAAEVVPEIVDVLETEIERLPVDEIVAERDVLILREPVELTV
jgi:hypothetical protein